MRWILQAAMSAVVLAGLGTMSARANLVANPGFEADNTSSGPVTPPTDWMASGNAGADDSFPHSGSNDGYLADGSLSQVLATMAGATYTISFWVGIDDLTLFFDPAATFTATFGGTPVAGTPIAPAEVGFPPSYAEFTGTATAAGANTTLSFTGLINGADGPWYLDDIDVELAVPEPASVLFLLPALAALGLGRLRRV
jgi:hypothetical protein